MLFSDIFIIIIIFFLNFPVFLILIKMAANYAENR